MRYVWFGLYSSLAQRKDINDKLSFETWEAVKLGKLRFKLPSLDNFLKHFSQSRKHLEIAIDTKRIQSHVCVCVCWFCGYE